MEIDSANDPLTTDAATVEHQRPTPKGRGTGLRVPNRFESYSRLTDLADVSAWSQEEQEDIALSSVRTVTLLDHSRTILTYNKSPDIPFDRSINPYRGCEHGCPYCYARPSHAWLGLSPGLDFESSILYKPQGASLLRQELSRSSYRCRPIALGTNTDPWQPLERRMGLTRALLEVMLEFCQPTMIITKGAAIARDLDLLEKLAHKELAQVMVSLPTLQEDLARKLEPRAPSPLRRLEILRALADRSIPCGVMLAPVIPGLTDHEMEPVLAAAKDAGAGTARYSLLRLPGEVGEIFSHWLHEHYRDRAKKVLSLLAQARDGALNENRFGLRMHGGNAFSQFYANRFLIAARRFNLDSPLPPLNTSLFHIPSPLFG